MITTEKFRNACQAANHVFAKLNQPEYAELQSKLEYCIGSYDYDKNPAGLYQYGKVALDELKAYKAKNPRKVSKKVIDDLEKNIKA